MFSGERAPGWVKHEEVSGASEVRESYPAVPESVARARAGIARYARGAGFRGQRLDAVCLAVSEAVTNVVRHAYAGTKGAFDLTAGIVTGELWVLVSDRGRGMQAASPNPGLGLGLALMADAADHFVVAERAVGGTEVRLGFRLAGGKSRTASRDEVGSQRPGISLDPGRVAAPLDYDPSTRTEDG